MIDTICSVYALIEEAMFATDVMALWSEASGTEGPLAGLNGWVGEASAWGEQPHVTVLDATTTEQAEALEAVVEQICLEQPPPTLRPSGLLVLGTALVVKLECPPLALAKASMESRTRPYLARSVLSGEEWQRAAWWIRRASGAPDDDLGLLRRARARYEAAGAPPLPRSAHFRLARLVGLVRQVERDDRAQRQLDHFLTFGEPPWYQGPSLLHVTIASGIPPHVADEPGLLAELWDQVKPRFPPTRVASLAIMEEDPAQCFTVHTYDALTRMFVADERHPLKTRRRIAFAG